MCLSFEFSNSCGRCIRLSASLGVYYTVRRSSALLNAPAAFLKWTLPPRLPSLLPEPESREQLVGSWTFLMGTVKFAGLLPLNINSKMYWRSELRRKCVGFFSFPGPVCKHLEFFPLYTVIKVKIVECQGELTVWFFNVVNQICHFGNILNGITRVTYFQYLQSASLGTVTLSKLVFSMCSDDTWLLMLCASVQVQSLLWKIQQPQVHLSLALSFAWFY